MLHLEKWADIKVGTWNSEKTYHFDKKSIPAEVELLHNFYQNAFLSLNYFYNWMKQQTWLWDIPSFILNWSENWTFNNQYSTSDWKFTPKNEWYLQYIYIDICVHLMIFFYIGEWENTQFQLTSFSYMHADRRTYIYFPLDKRYSPIISTICGPNKF